MGLESIAFATENQVAKDTVACATVRPMNRNELNEWRAKRLEELARRFGGKTKLGRRLGYADGAYVGQMIRGDRPITEKTIFAVQALPGCAEWFAGADASIEPSAPDTRVALTQKTLSKEALDLAAHFDMLTNRKDRNVIYVAAMNAIMKTLADRIAPQESLSAVESNSLQFQSVPVEKLNA